MIVHVWVRGAPSDFLNEVTTHSSSEGGGGWAGGGGGEREGA